MKILTSFWDALKDALHDGVIDGQKKQTVRIEDSKIWAELPHAFINGTFLSPTHYQWAWIHFYFEEDR